MLKCKRWLFRYLGDVHFGFILLLLVLMVVALFGWLSVGSANAYSEKVLQVLHQPTVKQAQGLVAINEEADLPGTQEAREVVTAYEKKQEEKLKKELAEQKIRVAKAKAKAAAEALWEENTKQAWENTKATYSGSWNGRKLSPSAGTIMGPSGKETYYNLNMSVCVSMMRRMGFSEDVYPYEVRSDGVKTLGGYVMVAANLRIRPRGSFIMTSVGPGIVVDTGGFASRNPTQLDICVNW